MVFRGGICFALISGMICISSGCGGGEGENLIPVKGKVTFNGAPLVRGTVSFRPDKAKGNSSIKEPYGEITSDGTYLLFTNKLPGAPAGKYFVLVESTEEIDPKRPSATPKSLIPLSYSEVENPLLWIEVGPNAQAGKYDLKLEK